MANLDKRWYMALAAGRRPDTGCHRSAEKGCCMSSIVVGIPCHSRRCILSSGSMKTSHRSLATRSIVMMIFEQQTKKTPQIRLSGITQIGSET